MNNAALHHSDNVKILWLWLFFALLVALGGTSVLSHFLLLGGTSSILRTFRGGTSRKKHPVISVSNFTTSQRFFWWGQVTSSLWTNVIKVEIFWIFWNLWNFLKFLKFFEIFEIFENFEILPPSHFISCQSHFPSLVNWLGLVTD